MAQPVADRELFLTSVYSAFGLRQGTEWFRRQTTSSLAAAASPSIPHNQHKNMPNSAADSQTAASDRHGSYSLWCYQQGVITCSEIGEERVVNSAGAIDSSLDVQCRFICKPSLNPE